MSGYRKPLPRIDGPNRPFWDGARAQRLVLQRCLDCGWVRFPPSLLCPRCLSEKLEWSLLSGRGTVFKFEWKKRSPVAPGMEKQACEAVNQ